MLLYLAQMNAQPAQMDNNVHCYVSVLSRLGPLRSPLMTTFCESWALLAEANYLCSTQIWLNGVTHPHKVLAAFVGCKVV